MEFQARGSPHVHGILWLDWMDMAKAEGLDNVNFIKGAFNSIKNDVLLRYEEENALTKFLDRHVTVDRYNPLSEEIVNKVNVHRHSHTCYKHEKKCRFNFPRFPTLKTIISIPARVLEKDEEKRKELIVKSKSILKKVKNTLENEDKMKQINLIEQKQFEYCVLYKKCVHKLSLLIHENLQEIELDKNELNILGSNIIWNSDKAILSLNELETLYEKAKSNQVNISEIEESILRERLLALLKVSNIDDEVNDSELIALYENALKVNERCFSLFIKRKTTETYINNYNNEWINAWSANMDLQPSLDFYSVITYISEYYRHVYVQPLSSYILRVLTPIENC